MIGNGTHKHYLIPQPLPRPLSAHHPRPSNIWKQDSTRLAVTVKHGLRSSQYSPRDRCFSDGAFGNLVHRNCNRAGDSSCCITTRWALPNRKHLHMYIYKLWLVSMQQQKKCLQTKRISWLPPMFFFFFCMSYTMIEIYHENDRIYVSCWLLRVMVAKMHASEHHGGYKARFRASWWL